VLYSLGFLTHFPDWFHVHVFYYVRPLVGNHTECYWRNWYIKISVRGGRTTVNNWNQTTYTWGGNCESCLNHSSADILKSIKQVARTNIGACAFVIISVWLVRLTWLGYRNDLATTREAVGKDHLRKRKDCKVYKREGLITQTAYLEDQRHWLKRRGLVLKYAVNTCRTCIHVCRERTWCNG